MKIINLNESQYQRLFETDSFVTSAGGEVDNTPQNLSSSEVFSDAAVTTTPSGDEELVKAGDSKFVKQNKFKGARVKQDQMCNDGPWQWAGKTGRY